MYIEGSPKFTLTEPVLDAAGNPVLDAAGKPTQRTLVNSVITDYSAKKNGGGAYPDNRPRQDIYLPAVNANDSVSNTKIAPCIHVTGKLGNAEIWVWAEEDSKTVANQHYKEGQQFAVIDKDTNGNYVVSMEDEVSLTAFRNAQSDDLTTESGVRSDALVGVHKEGAPNLVVLGTSGLDVTFKKIDGFGSRLNGAGFKLFKDAACSIALREEESVSATDETTAEAGIVTFARVPNGIYYMQETTVPEGYANANTYLVLVGTGALTPNDTDDVWQEGGVLADIDQAAIEAQTGTGADALKFAIFQIDSATGKATALPDIAGHGVMNASKQARKVVLRKVDLADYAALENARFRIFRADMSEITEGQPTFTEGVNAGKPKGYYESLASGAFYIGQLPYGLYYIEETQLPSASYEPVTHYFVFKVDADGFWAEPADGTTPGVVTWKRTNILAQSGRDADALPTGD